MQQKYCDQGRSTLLLTITWPICFARSSWACGGKAMKASIAPSVRRCTAMRLVVVAAAIGAIRVARTAGQAAFSRAFHCASSRAP